MFFEHFVVGTTFKALTHLGVELRPPYALKDQGEFPDCAAILKALRLSRTAKRQQLTQYVRLCRVTGGAWGLWALVATGVWFCIGILLYHLWQNGTELNLGHTWLTTAFQGANPHLAEIKCKDLLFGAVVVSLFNSVAYSMMLRFSRQTALGLPLAAQKASNSRAAKTS